MSSVCFFIGHRDAPESIYPRIIASVERHIVQYGVGEFIVGKYGAFDRMAARAVREIKRSYPEIKLTLLLAYYSGHPEKDMPPGFDGSLYPSGLESVPKRAAIIRANMQAIRLSNHLIVYYQNQIGNTREFVAYASRRAAMGLLTIENLAAPQIPGLHPSII